MLFRSDIEHLLHMVFRIRIGILNPGNPTNQVSTEFHGLANQVCRTRLAYHPILRKRHDLKFNSTFEFITGFDECPHTLQFCLTVHVRKGTNVGATVAALEGLGVDRKVVVILGGEGKGQDFSPLASPVAQFARAVVLIGRDAPLIEKGLAKSPAMLLHADSMQAAVRTAAQQAREGDAVLMSPACASFDMFDSYEHRAQVFVRCVSDLADEAGIVLEALA